MTNIQNSTDNQQSKVNNDSLFQHILEETGYNQDELQFRTIPGIDLPPRNISLFYEKEGNVVFPYLTIEGHPLQYPGRNNKLRDYNRTRYAKPPKGKGKYSQPAGSGQHIYFTPLVIETYKNKTQTDYMIVTEGEKKALAVQKKLGIPAVSIPGIHGYKDSEQKNMINADFQKFIEVCKIKKIILVLDADALHCQYNYEKPEKDLYKRVFLFFRAVAGMKELIASLNLDLYLVVINPSLEKRPKGLDDLLMAYSDSLDLIKNEFDQLCSGFKNFTVWHNVTGNSDFKLKEFFGMNNAERFYHMHKDEIGINPFVLKKRKYQYDGEQLILLKEENYNVFWKVKKDANGNKKGVRIENYKLIQFLETKGYARIELQSEEIIRFIRIVDNRIYEVSETHIQDFVIRHLKKLPEGDLGQDVTKEEILSVLYQNPQNYFSKNKLCTLESKELNVNKDTKETSYVYFRNGFVKITAKDYELHPYKELENGFIYDSQLQNRNFEKTSEEGNFKQFVKNIAGYKDDPDRFLVLRVLLGYLMHFFFDYKRKAVNLTDSSMSDDDEGRTGKTLLLNSVKFFRNYSEVAGKVFNSTNKHRYQDADLSTQVIHINDVSRSFAIEEVYNDITDGIVVDKKNEKPFGINAKIAISSNKPLRVKGASARDRIVEFELAQHYSDVFSPEQEFNQWFFGDWKEDEWQAFDNFMIECIRLFLEHGLLTPKSLNLENRKLLNETNQDFVDFIESRLLHNPAQVENELDGKVYICPGIAFCKKSLHTNFLQEYPEYESDKYLKKQQTFTRWLKTFAGYRGYNVEERKSGAKRSMIFFAKTQNL
ncbi:MAG: DUF3854 domain-containing protein [Bacteroidota bacterium]